MKKKIIGVMLLLAVCLFSAQLLEVKAQDEKTPIVTPGSNPENIAIRGMTSVGDAKLIGLYVHFPDEDFNSDDTLESFDKLINRDSDPSDSFYPFESLKAYYERASYGKLHISGNAFEYYASKESCEYSSINELVEEAMGYFDSSIDFSNYDLDNDGQLDGIYVHVPKYNATWGDQWWSQCFCKAEIDSLYDGKQVGAVVILHNNSNTKYGCSVACHETGHVLGLPDLYRTSGIKVDYIDRDGSLTWDLMDSNIGDINGYFKMLLGWIDYNDVTRIIANDNGIDVKKGNVTISHIDYSGEYISVEEVVRSLDKDPMSVGYTNTPGDLIIVSNGDNGLFSKFFLIQYDNTVGNQTAYYKNGNELEKVPSGFRIYRVNSELDSLNQFLYKNTDGRPFEQLIELLDYDLYDGHTPKENGVVSSSISGGFNCSIPVGATINSSTVPSTNFYEDVASGFTGLSFTVKEINSDTGRLEIGYSNAGKKSVDDFYLKFVEDAYVSNDINLELEAAWKIRALRQDAVKIVVSYKDGSTVTSDADAFLNDSKKNITVLKHFSYDDIKNVDKMELVFESGALLISDDEATGNVYNNEIRLALKCSTLCDNVEKITNVDDESFNMAFTSNVIASEGYVYQVHIDRGMASLLKVPVSMGTKGEKSILNYDKEIKGSAADGYKLYKCSEDYLILSYVDNQFERKWLWINLKTNNVDYTYSVDSYSTHATVCPDGNIVMMCNDYYNNTKSLRIVKYAPNSNELEVFEELLTDESLGIINAVNQFTGADGKTKVALSIGVSTIENVKEKLLIIEEDELISLVRDKQLNSSFAARAEYYGEMPFASNYYICDIAETEDKCLLITVNYLVMVGQGKTQQKMDLFLIKEIDNSNVEQLGRININSIVPSTNPLYYATVVGDDGRLALSFTKGGDDKSIQICFINIDDIINYSNTVECGKYLCCSSGGNGFFNENNQFCLFEWEKSIGEDGYFRYALAAFRVDSIAKEAVIDDVERDVSEESSPNTGDLTDINTLTLLLVISLVVFVLEVKYGRRISSR